MRLSRYDQYRSSGLNWLGDVPKHWGICQSRRLFAQRRERARASDEQLTASQKLGIVLQDKFTEAEGRAVVKVVHGADILKHVEAGDFVISMRSFQGGIEWSSLRGCISSAYVILTPIKSVYSPFFRYLLKCDPYVQALQSTSNLIRDGQALRYENFTLIDLPLIPLSEQRLIADFLDQETGRTDALIEEHQRIIDLLNEKVSSLVWSCVSSTGTRTLRLKDVVTTIRRPVVLTEGESYTPVGLFNRGRGLFHKESREMSDMGDSDFFWIEEGDLVISGQFAWEGAVALAGAEETGCVVSHRYPVLRGIQGVALTEYLLALLVTEYGGFLLNENSRGAAGRNRPLNIKSLLKEKVPVPDMQVQRKIAQAVHRKSALFRELAKQSELLKEHRRALISAAVTGQIDVRNYRPQEAAALCQ